MDFYRRAGFCISCRLNILDQQTSVGSRRNIVKLYKSHRFLLEILDKIWFISTECPTFTKYILPQENVNVNIFLSKSAACPAEKFSSAELLCCLICYSCMQRENTPPWSMPGCVRASPVCSGAAIEVNRSVPVPFVYPFPPGTGGREIFYRNYELIFQII